MTSDPKRVVKAIGKLAKALEQPLSWAVRHLPGVFPAGVLIFVLVDVSLLSPISTGDRRNGWGILHFDTQPTINVFRMKSSLGTLPSAWERPDPVNTSDDISEGVVELPEAANTTGTTLIPQLDADRFVDSLLFLVEAPDEKLDSSSRASNVRPTVDVVCYKRGERSGDEEKRSFVKSSLYFAAPNLGFKELPPDKGPQLGFNQARRVHQIGLESRETTQLIQSDVPNLKCTLFVVDDAVSAIRLIGERRITLYVVIVLGAIAMWIAGDWVLALLRGGVAILD